MADISVGDAFGRLLDEITAKAAGGDIAAKSTDTAASSDAADAAAKTPADAAKAPAAKKASVQMPATITPHLLTDAILNMGQLMPVTPAAPVQGSGKGLGMGLDKILKVAGFNSQGGLQNIPVANASGNLAADAATAGPDFGSLLSSLAAIL
jgi:hypothetical protein